MDGQRLHLPGLHYSVNGLQQLSALCTKHGLLCHENFNSQTASTRLTICRAFCLTTLCQFAVRKTIYTKRNHNFTNVSIRTHIRTPTVSTR